VQAKLLFTDKRIIMKKLPVLFYALACFTVISCMHNNDGLTDITLSESGDYYLMKAHFSKGRTRDVEEYMDSRIGKTSNMSFVNSRIDGTIALDDHTIFYIKKYPGCVEIKLDKDQNSEKIIQENKSDVRRNKKRIS